MKFFLKRVGIKLDDDLRELEKLSKTKQNNLKRDIKTHSLGGFEKIECAEDEYIQGLIDKWLENKITTKEFLNRY